MSNEMLLLCKDCGHKWTERIELPMIVEAALARMRGWECCPKCGGKEIFISTEDKEGIRGQGG